MARPKRSYDDCPYEAAAQALKCIGGRWKVLIVRYLLDQRSCSFNELQRAIGTVSPKMLAAQLRALEADGIVVRHELVTAPPKTVSYELTPIGRALEGVLNALADWGSAWSAGRNGLAVAPREAAIGRP